MRNMKLGVGVVLLLVGAFFAYRGVDLNKQVAIAEESMAGVRPAILTGCGPIVAAVDPLALQGFMNNGEVDLAGPCASAVREDGDMSSACAAAPRTVSLGIGAKALLPLLDSYECKSGLRSSWSIIETNASNIEAYGSLRYTCMAIGAVALLAGAALLALTLRAKPTA